MYCKNEIFTSAIDFSSEPPGWHNFDVVISGSKAEQDDLKNKIHCSAYLSKDKQIRNVLTRYELNKETNKDKEIREECQSNLGINGDRRISFPMYNMRLS